MSKWTDHVKKVYNENKKKNPNYKLGDAMKDARKTYKKDTTSNEPINKSSKKSRKSRKNKSLNKSRKSRK
jgi:hypothetical protein